LVTRYLEEHNVPTKSASIRNALNRLFQETHPSMIILDLQLSQDDGLHLLREIRSYSDAPVIITTGHRPDEIDRIVGLELGADDYIANHSISENCLHASVPYCGDGKMGRAARAHDPERGGYRFGGWRLERRGRRLVDRNEAPVPLSKGE
jgi:two-component system, OmpR family, response regulator